MGADLYLKTEILDTGMFDIEFDNDDTYFRDSYNGTSLLWRMDLSWWEDVIPMLDDEGCLSGDQLLSFQSMIRDRVLLLPTEEQLKEANCLVDDKNALSIWHEYLLGKREKLMKLIDIAVKTNSAIVCSL
jgi:hypothetical protein